MLLKISSCLNNCRKDGLNSSSDTNIVSAQYVRTSKENIIHQWVFAARMRPSF